MLSQKRTEKPRPSAGVYVFKAGVRARRDLLLKRNPELCSEGTDGRRHRHSRWRRAA